MAVKSVITAVLLCGTALTVPKPAEAAPLVSFVAGVFGASFTGASFGAYLAGVGFAGSLVGGTLLRIGASLLLSAAARALGPKPPGAPELIRELQNPTSLVPKRFIYGAARIYGSPVWRVRGSILYGCLILNSRPSDAVTALYFDKRFCPLEGDLYNLAGPGASATVAPFAQHVSAWVGLGDQVACPAGILAEAPGLFQPTDAGRGLTVLWLRLSCGENSARADRWPRTPPEVEVGGQWSKVWDPRDPAQNAEDPATWTWSANQALCALDAARTNPIRKYPLRQLMLDTFVDAANIADAAVPLKAGGTEPRYRVNGALIFNGSEIMDQLLPLFAAGASDPVRVGGRLAIAPGAYTAPILTIDDITEAEGLSFRSLKPGRELATTVHCTFTDPLRDWRTSELVDYTVPGAVVADGGVPTVADLDLPLVTSPTQAMRIQKIRAMRQRAQRQISCTLPPRAFKVVAGANATVAFPAPYERLNGTYRVVSANPGLSASEEGGGGVAMRVPVVLDEIAAADYAWDPATEEQDRPVIALDMSRSPPAPPGAIGTTTGAAVAIGGGAGAVPGIRFSFDPSPSASVLGYEWQYATLNILYPPGVPIDPNAVGFGAPVWSAGGWIDAANRDETGKVFGSLYPAQLGTRYVFRARAVGRSSSVWAGSVEVRATLDLPRYTADFASGVYQIDAVSGVLANVVTVLRASAATYVDGAGVVQLAGPDVPRIDHQTGVPCLLIEGVVTNLLTDSIAPPTQSCGVAAETYTLSFTGTGTVTLSGASTAGPLVGTGPGDRVQLSFVPIAGSLTLTISGSVTMAQLELGSAATSWIPTTAAPETRAADVPSMQGISAQLDLIATYDNGSTGVFDNAPVLPGFWPALTRNRLRSLIGTA